MSTQTPPEKMTLEQTVRKMCRLFSLCKTHVAICYDTKPDERIEIDPLVESQLQAISDAAHKGEKLYYEALLHLEGAQADKARLDWLQEKLHMLEYADGILTVGTFRTNINLLRLAIDSAMLAQTEGERP